MTEQLAEQIITSVLNYRKEGISGDDELIKMLESAYSNSEIDFDSFLEMMNTGAFRASFVMMHGKYPLNNLDDNIVIKSAFKMYWIEHKGGVDYIQRFAPIKKKWWHLK